MKLRSRIDLNLLAVFNAVYTRCGVTAAARHLNLSQSAISHALGRLRREFDDPLFVRDGNGLVPTTLARSIAGPVRDALRSVEVAVAAAARFDPATAQRTFRIGLRPSTEAHLFGFLAMRMMAEAPHVRLASVDFRRGELVRALADGTLDMALDVPSAPTAALCSVSLRADSLVVVARHGHPRIAGTIDLQTYLELDHIIASPRPTSLGAEDEALAAIGAQRGIRVRCQHIAVAWDIVAASDMILTVPRVHADALRQRIDMQSLPIPFDVTPRSSRLLWHEAVDRDPGGAWLRGLVREVAGESCAA